jgi:hypothetical protein
MTTTPSTPAFSRAERACGSLDGCASGYSTYIGTPTAPRAVISCASLSSATRREASLFTITTAATLAPVTSSGCASGARHDATKSLVEQAANADAANRTRDALFMLMLMRITSGPTPTRLSALAAMTIARRYPLNT